jgi:hypothetical protein
MGPDLRDVHITTLAVLDVDLESIASQHKSHMGRERM